MFDFDVVVIGGGGHVGLPLAIAFASRGKKVVIYDLNQSAVDHVLRGKMPFLEPGAEEILQAALKKNLITATTDPSVVAKAENVITVIGTPVDEHLNPDPNAIPRALSAAGEHFVDGQLLVLRSTIYPGVTKIVEEMILKLGVNVEVAFCPERIAEHKAMEELFNLPQIVSSRTSEGFKRASELFGNLTDQIVELTPEEAELAKLFTNTWRYIKFAAANQFYMMANDRGLDFDKIRKGLGKDYPRAKDMPGAGFAAGPCLFKDTMQLAAFSDNGFSLGHSAMLVNEGLPLYLVTKLEAKYDLKNMTVGILGMAFKAESDDIRSSLSYKLKRVLEFRAGKVLTSDPYVPESVDGSLFPLEEVLSESDILIIATPHKQYKSLQTQKPIADVWNFMENSSVI